MRRCARPLGNAHRLVGVFVLSLLLGGCSLLVPQTTALREGKPDRLPDRIKLYDVPFIPQDEYQCGPAALTMVMKSVEADVTLEEMTQEVYLPGRQGSLQADMLAAPRRHGLVSYRLAPRLEDVLRELAAGLPVIVLQDYGVWPVSVWHYAVVVGYDYPNGKVMLHSGKKPWMTMPFAVLEYLWKQSGYWAMVLVPPRRLPATATAASYVEAIAALENAGKQRAAEAAYATFLKRWPDNETAIVGLANSHYALGELAEAEAVLRPAAARHPESAVLLNNLAQTLADQGRNREALAVIERASALGGPFANAVEDTRQHILRHMNETR
ncbi:MAG: PA2778 family cysteine peptidase [Rhodocyclaceae bacterium]|nr:PA2778 family cysteine peptidase [Rhodocyclaceae bacterium]